MAQRSIKFCDYCESQESATNQVLPTLFLPDGKESCYDCAEKELRKMYGISDAVQYREIKITPDQQQPTPSPEPPAPENVFQSAACRAQKLMVEEQAECQVYILVNVKQAVAPGQKIMWGPTDKQRQMEIVAEVEVARGSWFARLS